MVIPTIEERIYFSKRYSTIDYSAPSMLNFLSEIYDTIRKYLSITPETSFLDIGCGKGYFLRYLREKGILNLVGIEPCEELLDYKVFNNIQLGSFESNCFNNKSFDIVFTCHTLHHLKQKYPIDALKEMSRISKRYAVIIEVNNVNLPMFLVSLMKYRMERNAIIYNRSKVVSMAKRAGFRIIYAGNLKSCYISGGSLFYKFLSKIGSSPYNMVVAEKYEK